MLENFSGVEFSRLYRNSGKEIEVVVFVFTSSKKREIKQFYAYSQWQTFS